MSAESTAEDVTGFSETDAIFAEHLSRGAAPAAVWGVFDHGRLSHANASGAAVDTAFRIASCTKSFTAAAVLSLRDSGQLSLDDAITVYVPEFDLRGLPTAASVVPTIRMLLTMSAGLPTDDPWADRQESMSRAEFDELLSHGVRFEAEPGTRFAYSNLGYAVLGRVIEVAAAQPYRQVVEQRLLAPLGLDSTGFDAGVPASGGIARGYRRHAGGWEELPQTGPGAFSAIGGLYSTVSDLARWVSWLARAFSGDSDEVLSAASRREMQQIHRLDQTVSTHPTGYGYGLFVEQFSPRSRVVSHSGGYPGFSAHMRWSLEEQCGVIAFENATYSRISDATSTAFSALLARSTPVVAAAPDANGSRSLTLWPETRAAQHAVNALLAAHEPLTEALSTKLFSENVELDTPLERRRAALAQALSDVGGLASETGTALAESSEGPAHLIWHVQARSGRLRVEIRMTPEALPRVQTLTIAVDRLGR